MQLAKGELEMIKLLTENELMLALNWDKNMFRDAVTEGMPHLKIGSNYRFVQEDVGKWMEYCTYLQMTLEESFVDNHGRRIDSYLRIDEIAEVLRLTLVEVYSFCVEGMPHIEIGKRKFFLVEDVMSYYAQGKKRNFAYELKIPSPEMVNQATIVVDGSFDMKTNRSGVGVVVQRNGETIGHASNGGNALNSYSCEGLAFLYALELIQREAIPQSVIYTDQISIVNNFKNGEVLYKKVGKGIKGKEEIEIFNRTNQLVMELKDKLEVRYTGKLKDGNKNTMYKNAHVLSRKYREVKVEGLDLTCVQMTDTKKMDEQLKAATDKNKKGIQQNSKPLTVVSQLKITFVEKKDSYCIYQVAVNGKMKRSKMNTDNPFFGSLALTQGYVKTRNSDMKIVIERIDGFDELLEEIMVAPKIRHKLKTLEMLDYLEKNCELIVIDNYKEKIKKYGEFSVIKIA